MRKLGAILLFLMISTQSLLAIPDYSRILPRPALMSENLVKNRTQHRKRNELVSNVLGGVMFLGGLVISDKASGANMVVVGITALGAGYLWKDPTVFETEGGKISSMPESSEVQFLEKQAMAANFILKNSELEKKKKIPFTLAWATLGIYSALEASPLSPFMFIGAYYVYSRKTEEEITADQIKEAIGYD